MRFLFFIVFLSSWCTNAQKNDFVSFLEFNVVNSIIDVRFKLENMFHKPNESSVIELNNAVYSFDYAVKELGNKNEVELQRVSPDSLIFELHKTIELWVKEMQGQDLIEHIKTLKSLSCFDASPSCAFPYYVQKFVDFYNHSHVPQILKLDEIIVRFKWYEQLKSKHISNTLADYPVGSLDFNNPKYILDFVRSKDKKYEKEAVGKSAEEFFNFTLNLAVKKKGVYAARLGVMYFQGYGTTKNDAKAFEWIEKAAEGSNVAANLLHAYMLENGIGTKKYPELASNIYADFARKEYEVAMVRLSIYYTQYANSGTPDFYLAKQWIRRAADYDNIEALLCLGLMTHSGIGHLKDFNSAYKFFERAAQAGNSEAMLYMWDYLYHGIAGRKDQSKAQEWLEKAVANNNAHAIYTQGKLLYHGEMYPQDKKRALDKIILAAEMDNTPALVNAGIALLIGDEIEMDVHKSLRYFEKAGDNGDIIAKLYLGMMYESGMGVDQNESKAREIYFELKDTHPEALFRLGLLTLEEKDRLPNHALALQYFKEAAHHFHSSAMIMIGYMYLNGQGVDENLEIALDWFHKAKQLENPIAYILIGAAMMDNSVSLEELQKALDYISHAEKIGLSLDKEFLEDIQDLFDFYSDLDDDLDDEDDNEIRLTRKVFSKEEIDKIEIEANNGDTLAMIEMVYITLQFRSDAHAMTDAVKWLEKAAALQCSEAMSTLGIFYFFGQIDGSRDYKTAFYWFKKGAEKNHPECMFYLGEMYYSGLSVKTDYVSAMKWYKKAANLGHNKAMLAIGTMYQLGDSVAKSCAQAKVWYQKALDHGNKDAKDRLKNLPCR